MSKSYEDYESVSEVEGGLGMIRFQNTWDSAAALFLMLTGLSILLVSYPKFLGFYPFSIYVEGM